MATPTVEVKGFTELQRDLKRMDDEIVKQLRRDLKELGEPVRVTAQQLAADRIRNIGPNWSRMRTGATSKVVYVAPGRRNRGGSPRPNLAGLLLEKAMEPALTVHEEETVKRIDELIGSVTDRYF